MIENRTTGQASKDLKNKENEGKEVLMQLYDFRSIVTPPPESMELGEESSLCLKGQQERWNPRAELVSEKVRE